LVAVVRSRRADPEGAGGDETVVDLAEQYGVSRKTIYKWLARYKAQGLAGLVDETRRRRLRA
jgi:transposase